VFPENRQRLLIAGDVADQRVSVDAGEDRCRRAQREAAKLAVLYLEDERRGGLALGIDGGRDAAKLRLRAQALDQFFIFGHVGYGARVVLEIAYQAARQILPAVEVAAALRVKDILQQMTPLAAGNLVLYLEEHECRVIPRVQVPQAIQRVRGVGRVVDEQAG